jgi:hypothetical protein
MLRFVAAGRNYRGSGSSKSAMLPTISATQFLVPSIVTELALRWSLWRQNTTMRTVRVKSGEVVTLLVSSLLCLNMSDHRYCPGDLIQWEQHQFVVLGVGRHRLWVQKTSGNGEVTGFTKEALHTLHIKNAIRLVKKRSLLPRVRTDKVKTSFTPAVLPKTSSSFEAPRQVKISGEGGGGGGGGEASSTCSSDSTAVDKDATSESASTPLSYLEGCSEAADFEQPSRLSAALLEDADRWTHVEDSCLIEWLELRARILGTHPLNLNLEQVTSPLTVLQQLQELGYSEEGVEEQMGMLPDLSSSAPAPCSAANEFLRRFNPLRSKSLISLRLRALLLLHLNDTLSPLLSVVYDPNTVDDTCATSKSGLDLMCPLNTMILAHRHVILLEVKFGLGFRLGWATMMSHCMVEGGANSVTTMMQKKAVFAERKHQPFADLSSGATASPVAAGKISFSTCPTELPILPFRSVSARGSSANRDLKAVGDSVATTVCALNSLNNPLHPSNVVATGSAKAHSAGGSKSDPQVKPTSGMGKGDDSHLHRLSVYYFEESTSCFLNWTTYGLSVPVPSSATAASTSALPPLSGSSSILALPVINMFVAEPNRLHKAISEYSKKTQLQQLFEQDFRWRLLTNLQSSLLGQFMQTMERLDVEQVSSKQSSGANGTEFDPSPPLAAASASFLSPVAPEGPWDQVLRSVFRGGLFWDEHMPPRARPVSLHVHFLPHLPDASRKEARGSRRERERHVSAGAMDSARSAATVTPRQGTASSTTTPTTTAQHTEAMSTTTIAAASASASAAANDIFSARDTEEGRREKEREELLRSLSLLPPAAGQPTTPAPASAAGGPRLASKLQRVFHLLQTSPAVLLEGGSPGLVSPWGLLQIYIVEAVAEVFNCHDYDHVCLQCIFMSVCVCNLVGATFVVFPIAGE